MAAGPLEILVLYDNTTTRTDAQADWGFAALVTHRGERVLFDSGTKPDLLPANLKVLGVDPAAAARRRIGRADPLHRRGGQAGLRKGVRSAFFRRRCGQALRPGLIEQPHKADAVALDLR
jgi:hypothetical protein